MSDLLTPVLHSARAQRLLVTLERLLAIEAVEIHPALAEASQLLAEVLSADKVDVFLFDPAHDELVAAGTSDTPMGRLQHELGLHRLPLANGGRAVECYRSGEPFLTGHTEADPDEVRGIREDLGVRSSLIVPYDVQSQRRGVLSITSAQPDLFDTADLDFLQAVARWIGSLVHRGELAEQQRAEAAIQARRQTADELIAVLAHDLRTPLTPLFGYADMIQVMAESAGQPPMVKAAAAMSRGLRRLQRMIDDLLDTSRLDRGVFMAAPEPVDLVPLIHQTLEAVGLAAPDVALELPGTLVARVDPVRIQQALENLLGNARRYAPAGTPITVRAEQETLPGGDYAVISVQDRGPGVAPDLLPRLFTRFASGPGSRGLGLGLYLARGIAEAHGGTIQVESVPGAGATFRLLLPVAGPAANEDRQRA